LAETILFLTKNRAGKLRAKDIGGVNIKEGKCPPRFARKGIRPVSFSRQEKKKGEKEEKDLSE